ncbi:LLM class flavin-dependent oxidoreductase [Streptomyces cyaneofuscatus]|uniref:LLM class flavin-dependent oxidoreductase n=1 Tax=Streptomyces cyaneofuscatus TaxID=66883 RepID=UPI0033BD4D51
MTSDIRLGSGALRLGHRTALSAVEEFELLDAVHPGRFDLGLGRSGGPAERGTPVADGVAEVAATVDGRAPNGLLVPERYSNEHLLRSPRLALHRKLLQLPGAESQAYGEQVGDILALLAGAYAPDAGFETRVVPGESAALQLWVLGSSAGISAQVAGGRPGFPSGRPGRSSLRPAGSPFPPSGSPFRPPRSPLGRSPRVARRAGRGRRPGCSRVHAADHGGLGMAGPPMTGQGPVPYPPHRRRTVGHTRRREGRFGGRATRCSYSGNVRRPDGRSAAFRTGIFSAYVWELFRPPGRLLPHGKRP